MAGIHLPDIGKLGIHIATGLRDKKKVAPSNMAENARLRALSTRLDAEKHERGRILKKEERRMKRRKHKIDRRRDDIQKTKKQEINNGMNGKIKKEKFLPLISYPNNSIAEDLKTGESEKEFEDNSRHGSPSSAAIFPIQDDLRLFGGENRTSEKRKIFLPPLEVGAVSEENKAKHKKMPHRKKVKKNSITKSETNASVREHRDLSDARKKNLYLPVNAPVEIATTLTVRTVDDITVHSSWEEIESVIDLTPEKDKSTIDGEETQTENGIDVSIDLSVENPFNYLLVEAERRKALHQNLEDAFRAIKTCRYTRTPSRKEGEIHDDESL